MKIGRLTGFESLLARRSPITYALDYFAKATRSVNNLANWMKHDIEKAIRYAGKDSKSQSVFDKVKDYIAQNIGKELTCEEVASQVYLSSIYLSRIFKKETGFGLSEYIQQERMKIAQNMLSNTTIPVGIIAANIGYSNFSHFSRQFKKCTGFSPIDYRKKAV